MHRCKLVSKERQVGTGWGWGGSALQGSSGAPCVHPQLCGTFPMAVPGLTLHETLLPGIPLVLVATCPLGPRPTPIPAPHVSEQVEASGLQEPMGTLTSGERHAVCNDVISDH